MNTPDTEWEVKLRADFDSWYKFEPEMNPYIMRDWFISRLHQELQKAPREMLHKLHLCAIGKYEGDALENVKAQIKEYQEVLTPQPDNNNKQV